MAIWDQRSLNKTKGLADDRQALFLLSLTVPTLFETKKIADFFALLPGSSMIRRFAPHKIGVFTYDINGIGFASLID